MKRSESRQTEKDKPYQTGMTARIREAARRLNMHGSFSRTDVFNRAEIPCSDMKNFRSAWVDLRKRGELVRLAYGQYHYDAAYAPKGGGVKRKVYRAMHVKGAFCAPDIAKLADAEISYVHGVIRRLVETKDLELTGKRGNFKYFRVRNSEKFYLEKVK